MYVAFDFTTRTNCFEYTIYAIAQEIHFCMPWSLLIFFLQKPFWHMCYLRALTLAQFWLSFLTFILIKQSKDIKRAYISTQMETH